MVVMIIAGALVFLATMLVVVIVGKRALRSSSAPPFVGEGVPVVGSLLGFASGPVDFIKRNYDKHGSAFSMQAAHKTLTFLIGPTASAPFFQNNDEVFSQSEVYGFMTQVFGKNVVYDAPPDKRKSQMQHMSRGLRADRLKSYVPKITAETKTFLRDGLAGSSGSIDAGTFLGQLTILTASRCLHGDDVRENLFKEVSDLYHDLDQGITPLAFFWPTAPTANHAKRDKARVEMVKLFSGVIAQRRLVKEERTDILQVFIDMQYKDGTRPTDDEITGLLIALLFAGQHTSAITSTWTLLYIAANPELKARLLDEQSQVLGDETDPTYDHLQKMDLLHNCIKETLRMHPPLIMLMRQTQKDVTIKTENGKSFVLPKGDIAVTSPAVAGMLPSVYKNPEKFDPDRYAPPREEHKSVPFAHLGFGAGIHQCMGQQFGYMQVKTILSIILRDYDITLPPSIPFPEPDYTAMVVGPKGATLVNYAKKN